jgi:hypothetical protein
MSMRGSRISENFSRQFPILVALSGIAFLAYKYLNEVTTSKTSVDYSQKVFDILQASGLNDVLSRFATSQAAFESSGFTSSIFKTNNNAFGMKYQGQVNAIGEKNGYANYLTVNESVADFVAWYTRHRANILSLPLWINSLDSYVSFLKNQGYFESDEAVYLAGCQSYYNQIFDGQ